MSVSASGLDRHLSPSPSRGLRIDRAKEGKALVSQRELAELLGLTTRQIRNLEGRGLPVSATGNRKRYPIPDAIRWYVASKGREAADAAEVTPYDEALARKTLADARIAERKLAELDAALIPAALHRQVLSRVSEGVAARIRNLPGEWAPRFVGIPNPRQAGWGCHCNSDSARRLLCIDETGRHEPWWLLCAPKEVGALFARRLSRTWNWMCSGSCHK
ncbi:MAG: hypothetical protein EA421_05365 [Gemmatimonadales bacterium]|nr:MAG: hypothetical protein EA421_05365 [Gemmatimonadales bacterium]